MTKEPNNNETELQVVDLLPLEQGMAAFGHAQPMSTLTWFEGDATKATALLKERADTLLRVNPWLTGRVRKTRHGGRKLRWALVYNPKGVASDKEEDSYFRVVKDVVSRDIPLVDLASELKDHLPKNGPDYPLWRVSICPCAVNPTKRFAVVVSLSHIVGDGHTFFQLQNIVLGGSSVESFVLDRISTTEEQQIQAMGGKKDYGLIFSPGLISNFLRGTLNATCFKKYKASAKIYLVDPEGMKQAKKDAVRNNHVDDDDDNNNNNNNNEFVSSNDILSSWFFQNSGCTHGFMAINFRGRLKGHTDRHAGNYEGSICYPRKDSVTPNLIRKSVSSNIYQRYLTRNEPLPGYWEMAFGTTLAICSNWASFARPANLGEGFIEDVQIPLYEVVVPSTGVVCIVFRAGPKGLAIILAGSRDKLEGLEKQVPFLKPYNDK